MVDDIKWLQFYNSVTVAAGRRKLFEGAEIFYVCFVKRTVLQAKRDDNCRLFGKVEYEIIPKCHHIVYRTFIYIHLFHIYDYYRVDSSRV